MPYELAAMCNILPQVRSIARARVLDVDLYDRGVIYRDFPNERVSEAHGRLAEEFGLGYQYEMFALLCEGLGMRAECAVEDSPRSKAERAIDAQCLLAPCGEKPCGTCSPCKGAMAEGMRWRTPPSARLRYRAQLVRSVVFKMWTTEMTLAPINPIPVRGPSALLPCFAIITFPKRIRSGAFSLRPAVSW